MVNKGLGRDRLTVSSSGIGPVADSARIPHFDSMTDHVADRIVGHYEQHAVEWDRDRQNSHWNDKIWHDRFIARLERGAKVLDLGCGPGRPVGEHMVERGLHVTGVDSSPTMISLCRERLPDQEWIVADMRQLALGRCFDGILAWDSFFHLDYDDQRRMFAVFADHASAGAVLMFNTGPAHGESVGEYRGEPLYHASLSPSEYEVLIRRFGFDVIQHIRNDALAGGRTVWLCQRGRPHAIHSIGPY
jgi:SAM-dependent methyltransferase